MERASRQAGGRASKTRLCVHKMFCNSSEFLWSLKYRVNLKGTPPETVQPQKHNASLLISNPLAYILLRHSAVRFSKAFNTHAPRCILTTHATEKYKPSNRTKTHSRAELKYTLLSGIIYDVGRYMMIAT